MRFFGGFVSFLLFLIASKIEGTPLEKRSVLDGKESTTKLDSKGLATTMNQGSTVEEILLKVKEETINCAKIDCGKLLQQLASALRFPILEWAIKGNTTDVMIDMTTTTPLEWGMNETKSNTAAMESSKTAMESMTKMTVPPKARSPAEPPKMTSVPNAHQNSDSLTSDHIVFPFWGWFVMAGSILLIAIAVIVVVVYRSRKRARNSSFSSNEPHPKTTSSKGKSKQPKSLMVKDPSYLTRSGSIDSMRSLKSDLGGYEAVDFNVGRH